MNTAYPMWEAAEKEAGTSVYTKTGGLDLAEKNNKDINRVIAAAKKWNIEVKVLENSESIHKQFPNFNPPKGYIGLYSPDSGILNATKAVAMFQMLARDGGCVYMDGAQVVKIKPFINNGQEFYRIMLIVDNRNVEIVTEKCILTAGPWTNKLLKCVSSRHEM